MPRARGARPAPGALSTRASTCSFRSVQVSACCPQLRSAHRSPVSGGPADRCTARCDPPSVEDTRMYTRACTSCQPRKPRAGPRSERRRTRPPVAEVDGNRTRRTGIARPDRFEGGGAHQVLGHLPGGAAGLAPDQVVARLVVGGAVARRAPRAGLERASRTAVDGPIGVVLPASRPTRRAWRWRRRGAGRARSASSACAAAGARRASRRRGPCACRARSRAVRIVGAMPSTAPASSPNVRSPSSRAPTMRRRPAVADAAGGGVEGVGLDRHGRECRVTSNSIVTPTCTPGGSDDCARRTVRPRPHRRATARPRAVVSIGRHGRGTGFVVAPGKVLTNAHNLRAETTEVGFADGRTVQGAVAGSDVDGDLVVLDVDTGDVAPLEWSTEAVAPGDVVVTVTAGRHRRRAAWGQVTGTEAAFRGPRGRPIQGAVEHTAPCGAGSSGAPVLDRAGASSASTRTASSTASTSPARPTRRCARPSRRWPRAAASSGPGSAWPSPRPRSRPGCGDRSGSTSAPGCSCAVSSTESPAAAAGIREGDLLTSGRRTASWPSPTTCSPCSPTSTAGAQLAITLVRGAEELTVTATF